MDRIRQFWQGGIDGKIKDLEKDIAWVRHDREYYPKDSFGYAWRTLAIRMAELKIELWRALP